MKRNKAAVRQYEKPQVGKTRTCKCSVVLGENGLWNWILTQRVKEPTQAFIDSQSVKTTGAAEQIGFDM